MPIPSMAGRRARRVRGLDSGALLAPLVAMLALWLWVVAEGIVLHPGRLFDVDYAVYLSAAHILAAGKDPYSHAKLLTEERYILAAVGHLTIRQPALTRVGEPAVLFWAFGPLGVLPFRLGAAVMNAILAVGAVVGGIATYAAEQGRSFRWREGLAATAILLAMPPTVIYILNGNIGVVMFAAVGLGLWQAPRHSLVAGIILSLTIVKPQVALPLAGLILLFQAGSVRRGIAGFGVGGLMIVGASALVAGPQSIGWWVAGIHDFSGTIPVQGAMPSLAGLYEWAPGGIRSLLSAAVILTAAVATIVTILQMRGWRRPVPLISVAWLWVLWFLAAPYCHLMDEVFLAPVVLAMLGQGNRTTYRAGIALIYGVILSVLPIPLPGGGPCSRSFRWQLLP